MALSPPKWQVTNTQAGGRGWKSANSVEKESLGAVRGTHFDKEMELVGCWGKLWIYRNGGGEGRLGTQEASVSMPMVSHCRPFLLLWCFSLSLPLSLSHLLLFLL